MVMEERAHIAEEEVTQILSRKMDLLQKVIEMAGRRLVIEYDLRLEQCSLLVLKGEEDSLAQDLDYAYDSHLGVVQVIEALQSELDGLYYC